MTAPFGPPELLSALPDLRRLEQIETMINPPVMLVDIGSGEEVAVPIDAFPEQIALDVQRARRRRSALRGWETRRKKELRA